MTKIINQERMRITNKRQILEFVRSHTPTSKKEIADQLGLSTTSVATFITELMNEGKIINCGMAPSTGGRKSILYQFNPDALYVIGIDLQVDRLIGILLNYNGERISTHTMMFSDKREWHVADLITELIKTLCLSNGIPDSKLRGVGIGVPGTVRRDSCMIEFAPNLGWKNANLRQLLRFPQDLLVENEANAGAIGERSFGVGQAVDNLVYISIGIGVGTGLIFNNKLYSGFSEQAGEFGHMIVESDGLDCRCGQKGCWEVYTSNEAALKLYSRLAGRQMNSYDEFLMLLGQGDAIANEVCQSLIKYLGIGISNLVNGFNPEMVVIGGKLAQKKDLLYVDLWKQCKERCLERSFLGLMIAFSDLEDQATALGAARLMLDRII